MSGVLRPMRRALPSLVLLVPFISQSGAADSPVAATGETLAVMDSAGLFVSRDDGTSWELHAIEGSPEGVMVSDSEEVWWWAEDGLHRLNGTLLVAPPEGTTLYAAALWRERWSIIVTDSDGATLYRRHADAWVWIADFDSPASSAPFRSLMTIEMSPRGQEVVYDHYTAECRGDVRVDRWIRGPQGLRRATIIDDTGCMASAHQRCLSWDWIEVGAHGSAYVAAWNDVEASIVSVRPTNRAEPVGLAAGEDRFTVAHNGRITLALHGDRLVRLEGRQAITLSGGLPNFGAWPRLFVDSRGRAIVLSRGGETRLDRFSRRTGWSRLR